MTYATHLQSEMDSSLATLLLQLVFVLTVCRVVGYALQPLKQPPVSGEILAGVLMGPSVMGQSKMFADFMFPERNAVLLKGISDLGVTMFMFILGLEFSPAEMAKTIKKTWVIGACGIIFPFGLGAACAPYLYEACGMSHEPVHVDMAAFILFVGAAMSFTAFPVLARILTANDAMTAQIGLVSMGVASVDDVLAWTVLAVATSYIAGGSPQDGFWGILISFGWILALMIVIRPTLGKIKPLVSHNSFVMLTFLGMCVSAWFTQVLGLHAFFGAFCFGISVPKDDQEFIVKFIDQLEIVVINFFVPLFFATTGLRTDLTQLSSSAGPILLVIALATIGKMAPALFLGRCRGWSWRFSFELASLLNARGLIALVALELARESNAFNVQVYSVFVIMALVTTFMAGPMFYFSYRKSTDPPQDVTKVEQHTKTPSTPKASKAPGDVEAAKEETRCVEIPVAEQMDLTTGSYGYLFHTLYQKEQAAERERASVMDVFNLHHPRTSGHHSESVSLHTRDSEGQVVRRGVSTPGFESLRSVPHAVTRTVSEPTPSTIPEAEETAPMEQTNSAPNLEHVHSSSSSPRSHSVSIAPH